MNLEGAFAATGQVQVQVGIVTLLDAVEGFQALGVLCQTAKAKVFETDDTAVLNTSQVHGVVPHIEVVLHILVAVGAVHKAGDTGRIIGIGRQTENLETFASHLGTGIVVAIGSLGGPLVILAIRVVTGNLHDTTLGNGFLVPCYLHRSHHRLTGIAETAWWTVIEHIPLAVDFLQ